MPATSLAQTASTSTQPVTVATVNIYGAKIVSQQNGTYTISFQLSNRQGAQPGVRYAVELLDSQQNVADEDVYPDVLNLGANTTIPLTVQYTPPSYVSGTYQMVVLSDDVNGLPLAQVSLGNVTLSGSGDSVQIDPSSCYLTIPGDKSGQQYTLDQGVDIAASETLQISCVVKNNSGSDLSLQPVFQTFYRTTFGSDVAAAGASQTPVSIAAGAQKTVVLTLPKPATPQAYDVQLSFTDASNIPSNSVVAHYVLDGASATIQNLTLDNTSYQPGQIADATLYWTGPANDFPDARVAPTSLQGAQAGIHIVNASGNSCGTDVSAPLNAMTPQQVIQFPMTSPCVSPAVTVTLTDASGTVLAVSTFNFTAPPSASGVSESDVLFAILALCILLIGGYVALRMRKTGSASTQAMLLFLLLGSAFSAGALPQHANADTFSQNVYLDSAGMWSGWYTADFTVNLDNSVYAPGATITASGNAEVGACANSLYADVRATINGQTQEVTSNYQQWGGTDYQYETQPSPSTFTAPTVPGTYDASFYYELYTPTSGGGGAGSFFCLPAGTQGTSQMSGSGAALESELTGVGAGGYCADGTQAPDGDSAECTCAQGNQNACEGLCPDGSPAPNGDPTQCSCYQGNLSACYSGTCPDGSAAPGGNPAECSCAQGNHGACNNTADQCVSLPLRFGSTVVSQTTPAMTSFVASQPYNIPYTVAPPPPGTCPNGSAAPNGDSNECSCSQGNLSACSNACPNGSAAPNGDPSECSCTQGNANACNNGGNTGNNNGNNNGSCPAGAYNENGSCVYYCDPGYTAQGTQCVFSGCPSGYSEQSDPQGDPECVSSGACSGGYICHDGSLYYENASCTISTTPTEICSYGCSGDACLTPTPPDIASWKVAPILLKSGESTNVSWQSDNVSSCSVTGSNGDSWSGSSGSETSSPITGQTIYTLACTGLDGTQVSTSTTINIAPEFEEE